MSRKAMSARVDAAVAAIAIPRALLGALVQGPITAAEVRAASMAFEKALVERARGAELSHHLGSHDGEPRPEGQANYRSGNTGKTVRTDNGPVQIAVLRDRDEASSRS